MPKFRIKEEVALVSTYELEAKSRAHAMEIFYKADKETQEKHGLKKVKETYDHSRFHDYMDVREIREDGQVVQRPKYQSKHKRS